MGRIKMVEINTEMLWRDVKRNGAKLHFVSRAIGRQPGYMHDVFRRGRISVKALNEVSKLLGEDPEKYVVTTELKETPAMAKPEAALAPAESEVKKPHKQYKPRKQYTPQEKADFLKIMRTAGRKGVKLPRINMAFAPEIYEYIQTVARASGISMTDFVNLALREHARNHEELYSQAIEIRNSL